MWCSVALVGAVAAAPRRPLSRQVILLGTVHKVCVIKLGYWLKVEYEADKPDVKLNRSPSAWQTLLNLGVTLQAARILHADGLIIFVNTGISSHWETCCSDTELCRRYRSALSVV